MTPLIKFLEARIAEDEATARATLIDVEGSGDWRADERPVALTVDLYRVRDINARPVVEEIRSLDDDDDPDNITEYVNGAAVAQHVARHDPARVLREFHAKRVMLDDHGDQHECTSRSAWAFPYVGCDVLRQLAVVYSDHPEFRKEWTT